MSLAALLNQPVDIISRTASGTRDEYGNEGTTEGPPYETVGYGEQTDATEVLVDRETYISDWRWVFPAGTPIDAGDRFESLGQRFEVIGNPANAWNPRLQVVGHIELRARAVTG